MATKKKPDDAPAEANGLGTRYEFTVPGREVTEQLNLRVPSEYGGARHAAIACFHAIWDPGSNNPTTVVLDLTDGINVSVTQGEYVHGG